MRTPLSYGVLLAVLVVCSGSAWAQEPDSRHPVVGKAILKPATAHPGGTVTVEIRLDVAAGWHIYAKGSPGPEVQTTVKLVDLPKGVASKGEWTWPTPNPGAEGTKIYEGEVTIRRTLQLSADVPTGPIEIGCQVTYQACNATACKPPGKLNLKATGKVK